MPAPLSVDLRKRIVAAWEQGEGTWEEIANTFKVGVATVNRLIRRYRALATVEPAPHAGGQRHRVPEEDLPLVRALLDERPDLTVEELLNAYCAQHGKLVSRSTMSRAIERLGYTRKKSPSSRSSATGRARLPSVRTSSKKSAR